jgi:hypothetical protein
MEAGAHEEEGSDQPNLTLPVVAGAARVGGTERMSHLDGICVEYIQALEGLQDRVREAPGD